MELIFISPLIGRHIRPYRIKQSVRAACRGDSGTPQLPQELVDKLFTLQVLEVEGGLSSPLPRPRSAPILRAPQIVQRLRSAASQAHKLCNVDSDNKTAPQEKGHRHEAYISTKRIEA